MFEMVINLDDRKSMTDQYSSGKEIYTFLYVFQIEISPLRNRRELNLRKLSL